MRTHKKYIRDATNIYYSHKELEDLKSLCEIAKQLDNRQVLPATSGNLSVRSSKDQFLITRSGYHKKFTTPAHFLRINTHNTLPITFIAPKPSDETKLHAAVYSLFPEINSVVHCHPAKLDSFLRVPHFKFEGHELLKCLGYKTHTEPFCLPVFKNSQDMDKLAEEIKDYFSKVIKSNDPICAFYLENHGIYCFGTSPQNAMNKLEVFLYF
jgi:methylthioribulose-1-phosphate dehydratase